MPIIKSAKKALRGSKRKAVFNLRRSRVMKSTVKEVVDLVSNKKKEEANSKLSLAYKAIDKAAKKGIIKKNTANRKKSRLAATIKKIA
jgi:small subunit ribosomal protein S20